MTSDQNSTGNDQGQPVFPPHSAERSDPTNPNHYVNAASWAEQVMRADFAYREQVDRDYPDTPGFGDAMDAQWRHDEIEQRWDGRSDALGREFAFMSTVRSEYGHRPQAIDAAIGELDRACRDHNASVAPLRRRSLDQVAGIVRDTAWRDPSAPPATDHERRQLILLASPDLTPTREASHQIERSR